MSLNIIVVVNVIIFILFIFIYLFFSKSGKDNNMNKKILNYIKKIENNTLSTFDSKLIVSEKKSLKFDKSEDINKKITIIPNIENVNISKNILISEPIDNYRIYKNESTEPCFIVLKFNKPLDLEIEYSKSYITKDFKTLKLKSIQYLLCKPNFIKKDNYNARELFSLEPLVPKIIDILSIDPQVLVQSINWSSNEKTICNVTYIIQTETSNEAKRILFNKEDFTSEKVKDETPMLQPRQYYSLKSDEICKISVNNDTDLLNYIIHITSNVSVDIEYYTIRNKKNEDKYNKETIDLLNMIETDSILAI